MSGFDSGTIRRVVPMDHACARGAAAGLEDPGKMIDLSAQSFRQVTQNFPAPVLIAGGPKVDHEGAMLQVVRNTLDAGGQGVVFGCNIWQSPDPARTISARRHLIREGGAVDDAAAVLA